MHPDRNFVRNSLVTTRTSEHDDLDFFKIEIWIEIVSQIVTNIVLKPIEMEVPWPISHSYCNAREVGLGGAGHSFGDDLGTIWG